MNSIYPDREDDQQDRSASFCPHAAVHIKGDASGPLAGLDFAAKDLFDVCGFTTGAGNPDWLRTHAVADSTSPVVQQLLDAGATLVGKTITDDLACGMFGENVHYGTPVNFHYPERVPGGSSSGSAAAVASGRVDFAIGTDTGGSIRVPASFCRIYGIRTSHGRISLATTVPMAPSFDTCGWFARDIGMLRRVGDAVLPDDAPTVAPRFRVAADMLSLAGRPVSAAFEAMFADAGVTDTVNLLGGFAADELVSAFWTLMSRQLWNSNGAWFQREKPVLAPGLAERLEAASKVSASEFRQANEVRNAFTRHIASLLTPGEIVLMPTVHDAGPLLNQPMAILVPYRTSALKLICIASLARLPQVVMPGVQVNGGHVGLSLLGGFGTDRQLLDAAAGFEQRIGRG